MQMELETKLGIAGKSWKDGEQGSPLIEIDCVLSFGHKIITIAPLCIVVPFRALLANIIYRRSSLLTLLTVAREMVPCAKSCVHTYMYPCTCVCTVDRLRHAHIKLNRVQQI